MNAKKELLDMVGSKKVLFGRVHTSEMLVVNSPTDVLFGSHKQFLSVLYRLDFDYDNGYGTQELFGTVVFTDGSWLERCEYDGSEWWELKELPTRKEVLGV